MLNLNTDNMNTVTGRILSSKKIQDHNTFNEPEKIKPAVFKDVVINKKSIAVTLPAASVVVLTIK